MMSTPDPSTANRQAPPDVFTVLLVVATLLMAMGVAWMVLVNMEHSSFDSTPGGAMKLVDLR
ncbi:MAG: hypothetical protein H8E86_04370 [Planctomycetes bacterium]|nr:hypothetical protein [Planctomycetota bacterium]